MDKILILAGPTASGKTDTAFAIAQKIPSEIISFDSMQVYQGMPIVTQAPPTFFSTPFGKTPVHLAAFLDPAEEYSAALFRTQASLLVRQILARGRTPLLVGGTGLYIRALVDGLFEMGEDNPSNDLEFRRRLQAEEELYGEGHLHERLKSVDPVSAVKIHSRDIRRIVRALEVFELTGIPLSQQKPNRKGIRGEYDIRFFLLERDRAELYERINLRVDKMREEGVVEEVQQILSRPLSRTAKGALGVQEIEAYLKKQTTLSDALELLKKNTRNYAKRQLSWFRHEKGITPVALTPNDNASTAADKILHLWNNT